MRYIVALPAFLLTLPAMAAETAWVELAPDVSVRLISAGTLSPEGRGLFGLEIVMPETTNTYWRVPGQAGFPTQFDFSKSAGVEMREVFWPYPERAVVGGLLDYVYHGDTIIPFELDLSEATEKVDLLLTIGICEEICIPGQAELSLPLPLNAPDRANSTRLRQALAEAPIAWDGQGPALGALQLDARANTIAVELVSPEIDPSSIIVDLGPAGPVIGQPQKSLGEDLVLLPILSKSDNSDLSGKEVEVTFMTDQGAYAVRGTLSSSSQ